MEKIEFRKVRDFSGLLNSTFEFIRQNFKIILKSTIFIVGPFILLAGVFGGLYQSTVLSFRPDMNATRFVMPFFLYFIFLSLAVLMLVIVNYSIIDEYINSENEIIEIENVWQRVKSNFWKILLTAIGYSITVALASLLLIIPGIYLAVALCTIFMVRIIEKKGFFDSISRCTHIIKNNWWFTFGLVFVLGLIQGFLGFIFYVPTYIAMIFTTLSGIGYQKAGGGSPSSVLFIITSIISSLGLIFYSISVVGIAFQYFNLVERKEATGLMAKIDTIQE
jgi:hypothetical protein